MKHENLQPTKQNETPPRVNSSPPAHYGEVFKARNAHACFDGVLQYQEIRLYIEYLLNAISLTKGS